MSFVDALRLALHPALHLLVLPAARLAGPRSLGRFAPTSSGVSTHLHVAGVAIGIPASFTQIGVSLCLGLQGEGAIEECRTLLPALVALRELAVQACGYVCYPFPVALIVSDLLLPRNAELLEV